ncbi:hypothetical protein [Anaerococcus sp. AGMB09787]|uniref:hypothetical protein n=1 Tax=Anaerococcus sp. AGMB09787 TaxID=2922869 RepID=UPI001FAFFFE9|nr:hypothetical protein [Anaerococcus sp. AGMB09787]
MKVKTTRQFFDTREDVYRHEGDEFTVNQDRFDELNKLVPGFVVEVKEDIKDLRNTLKKD